MANHYYHNPEEQEKGSNFGYLTVKKYIGTNRTLLELNAVKAEQRANNIGKIQIIREDVKQYDKNGRVIGVVLRSFWYLDGIDGEKYRGLEPEDGIDSIFSVEFKRQNL